MVEVKIHPRSVRFQEFPHCLRSLQNISLLSKPTLPCTLLKLLLGLWKYFKDSTVLDMLYLASPS